MAGSFSTLGMPPAALLPIPPGLLILEGGLRPDLAGVVMVMTVYCSVWMSKIHYVLRFQMENLKRKTKVKGLMKHEMFYDLLPIN